MKYLQGKFSLPAGPLVIEQKRWDFSILTKDEFITKYSQKEYDDLKKG